MTHKRTDPRIQRTENLLQDALVELTAERGFDAITVGDIAERAGVNRATFYRHYQDKYDLVERIFQEVIHGLAGDLGPPGNILSRTDPENPPERWIRFFEHFAGHAQLYRALLGRHGSSWFVAKLRDHVVDLIEERERLRDQIPNLRRSPPRTRIPRKVAITWTSTLLISNIAWWLESGRQYSPRDMASWFLEIAINGYVNTLGL